MVSPEDQEIVLRPVLVAEQRYSRPSINHYRTVAMSWVPGLCTAARWRVGDEYAIRQCHSAIGGTG